MDSGKFAVIIYIKAHSLCTKIVNYFGISYEEAMKKLYNSKLYKKLEIEKNKMWYFSSYDLFQMFIEEQETGDFTVYGG